MATMPRLVRAPLVGVAILLAGALVQVFVFPDEVACAGRTPVKIVSSTEKSDLLGELATEYNEAKRPPGATCALVAITPVSSGIAEQVLAGDPTVTRSDRTDVEGAQVWTPSSTFWLDRLDQQSGDEYAFRRQKLHSLARSPLVLAMPAALEHELGWDAHPPTWRAAMDALRNGKLSYTQENPQASTSGAMATYLTYAAAAAGAEGRLSLATLTEPGLAGLGGYVAQVQKAATGGFQNDSTDILRIWNKQLPDRTMTMVQEQMVEGYNSGAYAKFAGEPENVRPSTPLVAVHPVAPGTTDRESIVAEHPYVTLPGVSPTEAAAAEDFRDYVMEHWDRLCMAGFQSPAGSDPADCKVAKHIAADVRELALPDSAVQAVMARNWWTMRSTRRITIAMDASGSMKDTRVAEAAAAVRQAVGGLRGHQDLVEIYRFAGTAQYTDPFWEMRPLKEKSGDLGDIARPPGESATKMTAFYTTVDKLYRQVSARHDRSGANNLDVLIVLSDGIDDWDPRHRTTARAVCDKWKSDKLEKVPVYTIHYDPTPGLYGDDQVKAGREALEVFTACSGAPGSNKQSTAKSPLNTVFKQVMGSL